MRFDEGRAGAVRLVANVGINSRIGLAVTATYCMAR